MYFVYVNALTRTYIKQFIYSILLRAVNPYGPVLVAILTGFSPFLCIHNVYADNPNQDLKESNQGHTRITGRRKQLEQIVIDKLEFFAQEYPDINFVILDSAGDVANNMGILLDIIGQDPVPLDYEHPKKLRQALLMATLTRIEVLLQSDVGSATLFKPGDGALANRKQVCVITINPWLIASDDRAATRHLLELSDKEFNSIPPERYLDHISHLKFALDHEIYHCLDTLYNGSIPMSHRKYWGGYYNIKDESGADAFGILMNIAEHGTRTAYSRTLRNIRGLTLLCRDTDHYTYWSIGAVLQMDPAKLAHQDVHNIFRIATELRDSVIGSYDDYVRYANAANHAMKILGISPDIDGSSDATPDDKMVKLLVSSTKKAYYNITGHTYQSQSAPDKQCD
jgi:hypothetical protein